MKLTNLLKLPDPLVRAVTFSDYTKGDAEFSITDLIKPPRIGALERIHADEIEEDVSDRIWLLMGNAGHEVLRRSAKHGIVEERADVELDGCKISGKLDYALYEDTLWDFKITSLWAVKDGPRPDWVQQLNAYRWLLDKYGVPITTLKICAILRDWSLPESKRSNGDYPKQQVKVMELPLWTFEETEAWLRVRIAIHRAARAGQLPECTADEVWEKPEKFAVMKRGLKRAVKLYDKEQDAFAHASSLPDLSVQSRPGERPRCENYCAVSEFCVQWKQWKAANQPYFNPEGVQPFAACSSIAS